METDFGKLERHDQKSDVTELKEVSIASHYAEPNTVTIT
jgi:hypothetical protein